LCHGFLAGFDVVVRQAAELLDELVDLAVRRVDLRFVASIWRWGDSLSCGHSP